MIKQCRIYSGLIFMALLSSVQAGETVLWYRQPAPLTNWEEALPVGNGRLGAMVFGGVQEERIQLNEGNIWSGSRKEYDRAGAYKYFPEIRQMIYDGKYKEAQALVKKEVLGERPLGCYQPLGDLMLRFEGLENPAEYKRELNLDEAVARVSFRSGDAVFTREVFSSVPDQVIVVRLTCDKPGRLTFTAQLSREAAAESFSKGTNGLIIRGQADRNLPTAGTHFIGRLEARPEGGSVTSKDGVLRVEKADAVTLLLNAASDYRSADFEAQCEKQLAAASARSYAALREANIKEHQRLFRRVTLDLGKAPELPTDERLRLFQQGAPDPALIALYFQYGRYLMISSSRPGNLPANLQGIWNHRIEAPWFCGWHFDVNVEMNYWLAETANLSECHEPFFDLIDALRVNGRKTAKDVYGCPGFVFAHRTTAWLFSTPVNGLNIWPPAAGWCCQHLWEHYQFTQDREFLRNKGYPIMKEAAEFFLTWLTPNPVTGKLVSGPSISPENTFLTGDTSFAELDMGCAMDQQIAAELFDNCLAAGEVLGIHDEFIANVKKARANLADGIKIGSDGRILEWSTERPEREPGHRHLSHLYAVYPGAQISPRKTPELAEAARKSLDVRLKHGGTRGGGKAADSGNTGWSLAWNAGLWARLGDGERARQTIGTMISGITYPNLMDKCPWGSKGFVFQIDGNFGLSAAIIEMLLQSHAGEIELLPALPAAWSSGSVKGLRARGAFEVDLVWKAGQLQQATIHALRGGTCKVRLGERTAEFPVKPGEVIVLNSELKRIAP
jgi:alpha-L-fucosidase 2